MKENEPVEKKRDRSRTANADFRIDGLKPVADRFGRPPNSARNTQKEVLGERKEERLVFCFTHTHT